MAIGQQPEVPSSSVSRKWFPSRSQEAWLARFPGMPTIPNSRKSRGQTKPSASSNSRGSAGTGIAAVRSAAVPPCACGTLAACAEDSTGSGSGIKGAGGSGAGDTDPLIASASAGSGPVSQGTSSSSAPPANWSAIAIRLSSSGPRTADGPGDCSGAGTDEASTGTGGETSEIVDWRALSVGDG